MCDANNKNGCPHVTAEGRKNASNIVVVCPHCGEHILIEQLNCCIFRHGVLKETGLQMDQHASKEVCDYYKENDKIYGCGKPFKVVFMMSYIAINCDYI